MFKSEEIRKLERKLKLFKRQMRRAKTRKEKEKIRKKVFETDLELVKEKLRMTI